MKRLLVIGGSGLVGSALLKSASGRYEMFFTYLNHPLDLSDASGVKLDIAQREMVSSVMEQLKPDVIVHTAALRSLDYCEEHPDEARKVNIDGTENIALAATQCNARLIHISTDSVFDGQKGMFTEDDTPGPVTAYGRTKLEAEQKVMEIVSDALIVRPSSIYGRSPRGQSIAEWILGQLKQGLSIKMFSDAFFSPILSGNLAEAILDMHERGLKGTYHIAGSQRCSRYDFALEIVRVFELDESLVQPSTMAQDEVKLRAPRPRDSSLSVAKASGDIGIPLLDVRDGLIQFRELLEEA